MVRIYNGLIAPVYFLSGDGCDFVYKSLCMINHLLFWVPLPHSFIEITIC